MIDQKQFELLSAAACEWAKAQERLILEQGTPLGPRHLEDARRVGVKDPSRVRVLVVDRIPFPDDEMLAQATRRAQIITDASLGITLGYGIVIRADCWHDRELLLHQLVHVAQCERNGGLEPYMKAYLSDRRAARFSAGLMEEEARRVAREICRAQLATT
jgi:hypothetical protein